MIECASVPCVPYIYVVACFGCVFFHLRMQPAICAGHVLDVEGKVCTSA